MNKPVTFTPSHRLTQLLKSAGGTTLAEAAAKASKRLDVLKDKCVAALDQKLVALEATDNRALSAQYAQASDIYNLAATFGLQELAQAAGSLCDLVAAKRAAPETNSSEDQDRRYRESVRVHIDALRTLRQPELSGDQQARMAVVEGLRRLANVAEKSKDAGQT